MSNSVKITMENQVLVCFYIGDMGDMDMGDISEMEDGLESRVIMSLDKCFECILEYTYTV